MLRIIDSLNILNWRIDMNYIDYMKGGGIHIKEKNRGKFTESAHEAGKSVQEHATDVLNDPNATRLQKRRAQFAKNAKKWKHEDGGVLYAQTGASVNLKYFKNTKKSEPADIELPKDEDRDEEQTVETETTTSTSGESDDWISQYIRNYTGMGSTTTVTQNPTTGVYSSTTTSNSGDPRGFRNNNWLNIRISNNNWQGKRTDNTDGAFEQFETPEQGIRAAARNIKTYASRGLNTVKDIISTWAPASDNNNTSSYITNVSRRMGVDPNAQIDVNNPDVMTNLLAAMTVSENGREGDIEVIKRGVAMA